MRSLSLIALAAAAAAAAAFAPPASRGARGATATASPSARAAAPADGADGGGTEERRKVVVVSPPGGLGEVAAVRAAELGSEVRWFVVRAPASGATVSLPTSVAAGIDAAGGALDLAGADAADLLLPPEDAASALGAVARWCGPADGLVCTLDGAGGPAGAALEPADAETVASAVKLASREAAGSVGMAGRRVAVLPAPTGTDRAGAGTDEGEEGGAGGGLFQGLFGGPTVEVPGTLEGAAGEDRGVRVTKIRHGELFGQPESSPDSTPFVGGPRRDPQIRDEFLMRSVRIDPTTSATGGAMMGSTTRSSRLSLGDAAARLAIGSASLADGSDVFLTSLNGMDTLDDDDWNVELARCEEMLSSGEVAQLFRATFESVPDTGRLTDWVATKWAPAILRTYDLAGIRTGARPVYASKVGETTVEIIWQQLVDFKTNMVGKMIIEIDDSSIVARRAAGDPAQGYGSISTKPLAGEDILVRRLADAASQAIEKGLAKKTVSAKKPKPAPKKAVAPAPVATTVVSSGDVEQAKPSLETGPRTAGARRSSERARGSRRRKGAAPTAQSELKDDAAAASSESKDEGGAFQ